MSTHKDQAPEHPPSAPPAVLPAEDGYYWLHNLSCEGKPLWRIVLISYSVRARDRVAHWLGGYLTSQDMAPWKELSFHGPLHPPTTQPEPQPPKP